MPKTARIRLNQKISISELEKILGLQRITDVAPIEYLVTHSGECEAGDLFISLSRDPDSSRAHINESKERGAITLGKSADIECDPKGALLRLASRAKQTLPKLKATVAVTGSVGKTTTKEFLGRILSVKYKCHITDGNRNNDIGMPLTILSAPPDTEILVLECGMNHEGELERLSLSARPDITVITNIGSAHIGNLGSRERIAAEKLKITSGMPSDGILVRDVDEPLLKKAGGITFSSHNEHADYALKRNEDGGLSLLIKGIMHSRLSFCGANHLLPDLAAAIAVSHILGLDDPDICNGVRNIGKDAIRYKLIERNGYTIIDDAYNASYESVAASIGYLASLSASVRSALLGDILELGEHAPMIHRQIGSLAANSGIEKLFLVGKHSEHIKDGALASGMSEDNIFLLEADNLRALVGIIKSKTIKGEVLLIKASHACGLWRVAELLDE